LARNCNTFVRASPNGSGTLLGVAHVEEIRGADVEVVETQTTVWYLDRAGLRYARLPRSDDGGHSPLSIDWQPCARIEFDETSGGYAVHLDAESRSVLRFR